jgi:ABC-type sugar transport system permease subunit
MRNSGTLTVAGRKAKIGRLFILPFTIGFILFFLQPLIMSLSYSFSNITFGGNGMKISWLGLDNFQFLLTSDVDFLPTLSANLRQMVTQVPVIILFSMFIATILNQRFLGRGLARAVFFLPVIVSSGIIISILKQDVFNQSITAGSAQTSYIFQSSGIQDILYSTSLPTSVINYVTNVINSIFDMMWKSGVQILVFLAAIQSVPGQLYEAANIEGATPWESFWKITFPIISPMILVNVIYSIVDSFTDYMNPMMQMIMRVGFNNVRYSYACAMAWLYLAIILAIIGFVSFMINKLIFYKVD